MTVLNFSAGDDDEIQLRGAGACGTVVEALLRVERHRTSSDHCGACECVWKLAPDDAHQSGEARKLRDVHDARQRPSTVHTTLELPAWDAAL